MRRDKVRASTKLKIRVIAESRSRASENVFVEHPTPAPAFARQRTLSLALNPCAALWCNGKEYALDWSLVPRTDVSPPRFLLLSLRNQCRNTGCGNPHPRRKVSVALFLRKAAFCPSGVVVLISKPGHNFRASGMKKPLLTQWVFYNFQRLPLPCRREHNDAREA